MSRRKIKRTRQSKPKLVVHSYKALLQARLQQTNNKRKYEDALTILDSIQEGDIKTDLSYKECLKIAADLKWSIGRLTEAYNNALDLQTLISKRNQINE